MHVILWQHTDVLEYIRPKASLPANSFVVCVEPEIKLAINPNDEYVDPFLHLGV